MFTIVITKQNNTLSGYQFENFVSSYPKKWEVASKLI
jgi:hypothetical protein